MNPFKMLDFGGADASLHDIGHLLDVRLGPKIDIYEWQDAIRRRARAVHLGENVMLARALGRYSMFLAADDVGFATHIIMDGYWESWITRFMISRIRPGTTVVDVGANFGYYTLVMADLVGPTGKVLAFEPNPFVAAALRKTMSVNGFGQTADIVEAAVSDGTRRSLAFIVPPGEPKNGYLTDIDPASRPDAFAVPVQSLDDHLASHSRIDFLKIDAEGAEEAIIRGMRGLVARDRPEILLEFNAGRGSDPAGLLDTLQMTYGPVLRTIDHSGEVVEISRERVLGESVGQDWMLFFS